MKPLLNQIAPLAIIPLLASACSAPDFEEFTEIRKLRILGIEMEPPEIGPGQVSTIRALAVLPPESAAAITSWSWDICAFIEGPDDYYQCATFTDEDTGEEFLAGVEGISTSPELVVPYEILESFGIPDEICEGFADVEIPEFAAFPDCRRGFPITVRLSVETDDGQDAVATAELFALFAEEAEREDVNVNPTIDSLTIEGEFAPSDAPIQVPYPDNDRLDLQIFANGEDNAQLYEPVDPENVDQRLEEESETLAITWFSSRGQVRDENTYFARDIADLDEFQFNRIILDEGEVAVVGDVVDIHAVIRDDRGGLNFESWRVELVAP